MKDLQLQYQSSSESSKKHLDSLTQLLSEGKSLSKQLLEDLLEEVKIRESCFEEMQNKTQNLALPEKEYAFHEYVALVEKSEQHDSLKAVLQNFLSVGTSEKLQEILLPFQEKAKELSQLISTSEFGGFSEKEEQHLLMFEKFLIALSKEELDEDDDEELLDEIEEFFGKKLTRGLCAKKIIYTPQQAGVEGKTSAVVSNENPVQTATPPQEEAKDVPVKKAKRGRPRKVPIEAVTPEVLEEKTPEPTQEEIVPATVPEESDVQEKEAIEIPQAVASGEDSVSDELPIYLEKIGDKKAKKPSGKTFLSETDNKFARRILPFLYFFQTALSAQQCFNLAVTNLMTPSEEQLEEFNTLQNQFFDSAVSKGILNRFEGAEGLPPLFALSTYTIASMEKDMAKKQKVKSKKQEWEFKYWMPRKTKFPKETYIDSLTEADGKFWHEQNDKLVRMIQRMKETSVDYKEAIAFMQKNHDGYALWFHRDDVDYYTTLLSPTEELTRDSILVEDSSEYVLPSDKAHVIFKVSPFGLCSYDGADWRLLGTNELEPVEILKDLGKTSSEDSDVSKENPVEEDLAEENPVEETLVEEDLVEETLVEDLTEDPVSVLAEVSAEEEVSTSKTVEKTEEQEIQGKLPDSENRVAYNIVERIQTARPSEEEFLEQIEALLQAQDPIEITKETLHQYHNLLDALLLAYSSSLEGGFTRCEDKFKKLLTATHIPWLKPSYFLDLNFTKDEEAESLASLCFALLKPEMVRDYNIQSYATSTLKNFEESYPHFQFLKPFFNRICEALKSRALKKKGFSEEIVFRMKDLQSQKQTQVQFKERAQSLIPEPNIPKHLRGITEFKAILFGGEGNLQATLELIETPNEENISLLKEQLLVYCDCNNGEYVLNKIKLNDEINRCWKEAAFQVGTGVMKLEYGPQKKAYKELVKRVELIIEFVGLEVDYSLNDDDLSIVKEEKKKLLREIEDALPQFHQVEPCHKPAILSFALLHLSYHIQGLNLLEIPFPQLLKTGIIPLEEKGMPYFNEEFCKFRGYEPWHCVKRHIDAIQHSSYEDAMKAVVDEDSNLFDNLYQKEFIARYCKEFSLISVDDGDKARCLETSKKLTEIARDSVILAFTYGRIQEGEKELICDVIDEYHDVFCQMNAFACWKHFLNSIDTHLDVYSQENETLLLEAIAKERENNPDCSFVVLEEAEKLIKNSKNLAVAEEYLNRFKGKQYDLPEYDNMTLRPQYLSHFLSPEVYQPLHQACRENRTNGMSKLAEHFSDTKEKRSMLKKRYPTGNKLDEWTSKNYKSSKNLLSRWPSGNGNAKDVDIKELFEEIGFDVDKVKRHSTDKDCFSIDLKKSPLYKADYPHPIASLGTKTKPNMNVLLLFGKHTPSSLLDKISKRSFGALTFVLLDDCMTEADRRTLVELYRKENSNYNSFLLLDRVLLLHLALQPDNRLRIFLQCTLPFTYYQPFIDGQGGSSDEMFCGREKELQEIMDPKGAVILYGGRQLGKTALLERGISLCHKPQQQQYGVYCTLPKCETITEEIVVDCILTACQRKDIVFPPCKTIKALCDEIYEKFKNGEFITFHLFIDECDKFLESIEESDYRQIQPLVELRRESGNDFKFVLAGLHNVNRAGRAVKENGIFGQIGTLCIKPLKPQEALMLISRPLQYLGFTIDEIQHLETILANTNYYPGILQLFGYHLVAGLSEEYSKHYSPSKKNPPFTLSDAQLGSVMNSKNLIQSIKDKMRLSLQLDERYYMLARCIASQYHLKQGDVLRSEGVVFHEIKEIVELFDISCLATLKEVECMGLLSEMKDMGILTEIQPNCFGLRRKAFLEIIGDSLEQIEAEIKREQEALS